MKPFLTLAVAALMSSAALAQPVPGAPAPAPASTPAPAGPSGDAPAESGALPDHGAALARAEPVPGLAGPYLAARQAAGTNDFAAAARYYRAALDRDPDDPFLQDSALIALVSAGDMDAAVQLARGMQGDGRATELAGLIRRVDRAKAGDWIGLLALLDARPAGRAGGDLLDGMMRGWALMGAGKASEAFATFEDLAKLKGAGPMARFQLALAKASVGDYEAAAKALGDPEVSSHLLGIQARAQVLSQLERNAEAIAMLADLGDTRGEPLLIDLDRRLRAGERLPFTAVSTPADGIAQVLLTFAGALMSEQDPEPLALIHARLAAYLSPRLPEARLMAAQWLQSVEQFDLAEAEFAALRDMGEMRPVAELARIDALARADRLDDAEKAARALTEARPDLAQGWSALGDLLRQRDRFAEAVPAYDRALAILQKDEDPQASWFALYARGIALERSGQFDRADVDFRAALALQPEQAPILNYLGYSWVDRNIRLDEGLKLIEKAVELRPDDGYILDSLAWAYYRLGRYAEAVAPMEKAVSAMSDDSLVNDHMGDIYWMVGRRREAEIQWRRAQSLYKPADTDTDLNRIRAKLNVGLDAVLAAEKANGGKLPAGFGQPAPTEGTARTDQAADTTAAGATTGDKAPAGTNPGDEAAPAAPAGGEAVPPRP